MPRTLWTFLSMGPTWPIFWKVGPTSWSYTPGRPRWLWTQVVSSPFEPINGGPKTSWRTALFVVLFCIKFSSCCKILHGLLQCKNIPWNGKSSINLGRFGFPNWGWPLTPCTRSNVFIYHIACPNTGSSSALAPWVHVRYSLLSFLRLLQLVCLNFLTFWMHPYKCCEAFWTFNLSPSCILAKTILHIHPICPICFVSLMHD